jgi:hypothetical protein
MLAQRRAKRWTDAYRSSAKRITLYSIYATLLKAAWILELIKSTGSYSIRTLIVVYSSFEMKGHTQRNVRRIREGCSTERRNGRYWFVTLTPYLKFCKCEDSLFLININFWNTFLQLHFFKTDTFQGHVLLSPYRRIIGKYELRMNRNAFISFNIRDIN